LVVEQDKPAREKGFCRHPELYGQPAEKETMWGRHPQMMQRMKAQHDACTSTKTQPNSIAESKTNLQPISAAKP